MPRPRPVAKVSLIRVIPRIDQEKSADFPATMQDLARAITQVGKRRKGHVPEVHVIRLGYQKDGKPHFIDLTSNDQGRLHVALTEK